ncbi:MAG: ABC transporter permease [Bryobacteraceae bacterium]|nr:ABC transporter permease [Bryobacteraceae bacterium]
MRFVLRRLVHALLQLASVSVLSFALMELAPGDYLDDMKVNPQIPAEAVERWRERYGLDQDLITRYGRWLGSAARGEFGLSMAYALPVSVLIQERAWRTAQLSSVALLLTWSLAVPLGVACAAHPDGIADRALSGSTAVLLSLPDLLVGLLILTAAIHWSLGPVSGKLVPAVLGLSLISFPAVFRHTRSAVRDALKGPFILHLRALGIPEARIVFLHALRSSMNPIIGLFGLSLAGLTSSSLIIEVTLSWPGLGPLLLESILSRDVPVVLAAVLLSSTMLTAGNLAADLLLYASDPRIRVEDGPR